MHARLIHLSAKEVRELSALKREAEKDGVYRVARRFQAVLLSHRGQTSGKIAQRLKAPLSKVSVWLKEYEAKGWEALLEGHRPGRPKSLSTAHLAKLGKVIDRGPVAYGFGASVWTYRMIGRVIKKEFRVSYHPGHLAMVLRPIGYSGRHRSRRLGKAAPEEQDRWQRYPEPSVKKNRR